MAQSQITKQYTTVKGELWLRLLGNNILSSALNKTLNLET